MNSDHLAALLERAGKKTETGVLENFFLVFVSNVGNRYHIFPLSRESRGIGG